MPIMEGRITWNLLLTLAGLAAAAGPSVTPENDITPWAAESVMRLSLSSARGEILPVDYTIMPSTRSLVLNGPDVVRGAIKFQGIMFAATQDNFPEAWGGNLIAYMSCDASADETTNTSDAMLMTLMGHRPKAIVLYSTVGNWCILHGSDLSYTAIFTMTDAGDAAQVLEMLNNTNELAVIQVTITGNTTSDAGSETNRNLSDSAFAMTILYIITGLLTLLFLVIIGTGAVQAHRNPERYGHRNRYGRRHRQSRARGLARIVLETLPVVKFGDPDPPKPDPSLEAELGQVERSGRPVESAIDAQEGRQSQNVPANQTTTPAKTIAPALTPATSTGGHRSEEDDLGCVICTESFNVGEDVRVLPCNHKFHPGCIDLWLVNVSGTCPLCRLDLRPNQQDDSVGDNEELELPSPLGLDAEDTDSTHQRRTISRILGLNRRRHALGEEHIPASTQYRTAQRAQAAP